MEEDERKLKLRAGKEKLAQFQKKKKKKKSQHDIQPHGEAVSPPVQAEGDIAQLVSTGASLILDSDHQSVSGPSEEDTSGTDDLSVESHAYTQLQSQLQSSQVRVEELEESLSGKQLALDAVIRENEELRQLKARIPADMLPCTDKQNVKPAEDAEGAVDDEIRPTPAVPARSTMSDDMDSDIEQQQTFSAEEIQDLVRSVQWLQLQLKQAGGTLQEQHEKQQFTLSALQTSKQEILSLQDSIMEKDKIMSKLANRLNHVSTEYCALKASNADLSKQQVADNEDKENHLKELTDLKTKLDLDHSKTVDSLKDANQIEIERLSEQHQCELDKLRSELLAKVTEVETANKCLTDENDTLKEKEEKEATIRQQLELSNNALVEELELLKTQCETYTSIEKELKSAVEHYKKRNDDLSDENSGFRHDIEALKHEKETRNSEIKQLSHLINVSEDAKQALECQMSDLLTQIEACKFENDNLSKDRDKLKEELSQVQDENSTYQSQISEYEDKISQTGDLMEENHVLRVQNDELYNKINNQKDVIASLKCDLGDVSNENNKLVDQLKEMSVISEQFNNDRAEFEREREQLHSTVNDLKNQLDNAQAENLNKLTANILSNEEIQSLEQINKTATRNETVHDLTFATIAQDLSTSRNGLAQESEIVPEMVSVAHCMDNSSVSDTNFCDAATSSVTDSIASSEQKPCSPNEDEDLLFGRKDASVCESVQTVFVPLIENSMQTDDAEEFGEDSRISELQNEIKRLTLLNASLSQSFSVADSSAEDTLQDLSIKQADTTATKDGVFQPVTTYAGITNQNARTNMDDGMDENFTNVRAQLDRALEQLHLKTQECVELKRKIENVTINDASRSVVLEKGGSFNYDTDACVNHDYEVSDLNVDRIFASELEVNMHASSTPLCDGVSDLPFNDSVENVADIHPCVVDNGAGNQNPLTTSDLSTLDRNVAQTLPFHSLTMSEVETLQQNLLVANEESKRYRKEIVYLKEVADICKQERDDLLNLIQLEKREKESMIEEIEKREELDRKYAKENENHNMVLAALQNKMTETEALLKCIEIKNNDLKCDNEKLEWERDEFEFKCNELEKEILTIKTAKCDSDFKEEELKEELKCVKDRLEYLETSEKDFFEMREMLEKIQEEKDNILQENEKLQCTLSTHVEENDRLFETMDALHAENSSALENLSEVQLHCKQLEKELEKCNSDKIKIEKGLVSAQKKLESTESKYVGEMEGLLEENSTLKTRILSMNAEIETLESEMEKIKNSSKHIEDDSENLELLKNRNSELEQKYKHVSDETEHIVSELLDYQAKLLDVTNENEILLDKCDEFQRIVSDLDDEKTCLLEKIDKIEISLAGQSKELQMMVEKYELQLDGLVEENATLKTHVSSLKQDLQEVLDQAQSVDEEYNKKVELITKVEKENQSLESDVIEYKSKLACLEEDLLGLVEQVQIYDDTLTEKSDLASRLENEMKQIFDENNILKDKCNSLDHDFNELKESNTYLREQLKIFEESANSTDVKSSQIEILESQLELEVRYKKKCQNDLETAQFQIGKFEIENKGLIDELENTQKKLEVLDCERGADVSKIELLSEELKQATLEKDQINTGFRNGKEEIKKLLNDNSKLNHEVTTLHTHLHAVSENRNHVRTQVEILASEIESLMNERDDLASKYSSTQVENKNLKQNFKGMQELTDALNGECDRLKSQNVLLTDKLSSVLREKEVVLEENCRTREKIPVLEDEKKTLNDMLQELNIHISELKAEKEKLEVSTLELTSMLHDMQSKYEEVMSEMESTKKKCDNEILQLQSQLLVMNEDARELKTMLDFMENEMHKAAEEKTVLKENLEQQQVQFVETIEQKQKLEEIICQKQQKDLKNMAMVSKLNQGLCSDSSLLGCVPQGAAQIVSESYDSASNEETVCADKVTPVQMLEPNDSAMCSADDLTTERDIPSFDSAFQLMDFSVLSAATTETFVQTNISIGEFDRFGHLLDDNGEATENVKDVSVTDGCVQTEIKMSEDVNFLGTGSPNIEVHSFETQTFDSNEQCSEQESIVCSVRLDENNITQEENLSLQQISKQVCELACQTDCTDTVDGVGMALTQTSNFSCQTELVSGISTSCQCNILEVECEIPKQRSSKLSITSLDVVNIISDTQLATNDLSVDDVSKDGSANAQSAFMDDKQVSCDHLHADGMFNRESCNRETNNTLSAEICGSEVELKDNANSDNLHTVANETKGTCDEVLTSTDNECQTDAYSFQDLNELMEQKFPEKYDAMEQKQKDMEYRENKIEMLEKNYDRKVKQMEYDMEEMYEQKFRYREAEIALETEKEKQQHATDVEQAAHIKIEQIKMEKDRQFVETLQKVKADMAKQQKSKSSERRPKKHRSRKPDCEEDQGDAEAEKPEKSDVVKLKKDNQGSTSGRTLKTDVASNEDSTLQPRRLLSLTV